MLFLVLLIDFRECVALFRVLHRYLRWNVLNSFGNIGSVASVFHKRSLATGTHVLLVIFGKSFLSCYSVKSPCHQPITHKQMG